MHNIQRVEGQLKGSLKYGRLKTLDEEVFAQVYVKHKVVACVHIISSYRDDALNSELKLNIDLSNRDMNIHRSRATRSPTSG